MPLFYSPTTKGFYDTDEFQYRNLPDVLIQVTKEQRNQLIQEVNSNNKVIVVTDGAIGLEERQITWDNVRGKRDNLLVESDYTQLPDFPETKKAAWATYRQALRDIPTEFGSPSAVVWPSKPQ